MDLNLPHVVNGGPVDADAWFNVVAAAIQEHEDRLVGPGQTLTAYKPIDTPRPNDATYTTDPHLFVPVVANGVYGVEFELNVVIGAGGFKHQSIAPSGSTFENGAFAWNNGSVAFASSWARLPAGGSPGMAVAGHAAGASGGTPYRLRYALFVGGTAGSLGLQWGQDGANAANTTIVRGSWMKVTRFA